MWLPSTNQQIESRFVGPNLTACPGNKIRTDPNKMPRPTRWRWKRKVIQKQTNSLSNSFIKKIYCILPKLLKKMHIHRSFILPISTPRIHKKEKKWVWTVKFVEILCSLRWTAYKKTIVSPTSIANFDLDIPTNRRNWGTWKVCPFPTCGAFQSEGVV